MRVVHLTRDFPPRSAGGISTAVAGLAAAARGAGIASAVVSFDGWRPRAGASGTPALRETSGGLEILRIHEPAHLAAARAFVAAQRPDLLHVHHDLLWPAAAELRASAGVPAMITLHVLQRAQNQLRGVDETLSAAAQDRAVAEADLVAVPGETARALARTWYPTVATSVTPLAVTDDDGARAAAARQPRPRGAITYVGRFADVNGTAEVLEAFTRLAPSTDRPLAVAGGLPGNRRADARWWRRWREALGDRLTAHGWLDRAALTAVYARATVVVAPSWLETYGLVVAEAMLHGAPVIACAGTAAAARIRDGETGILVPPRDVDSLVRSIEALLADPAGAARIGVAAAAAVRATATWANVLDAHLACYRKLLR